MLQSARIRILIAIMLALAAGAIAFMIYSTLVLERTETAVRDAWAERYASYLLADELRQSSDDLTRLARTYVVTGDPAYETQYMDILAIRNGQKERPQNYHRIYWDFIAAGRPGSAGSGVTRPLNDLMLDAGFADEEFALLAKAQANSDGLVDLEVQAMNAVKGLYADGAGAYTVKGAPDMDLARSLLHSSQYHAFKADIMEPVNQFLAAMENRFETRIVGLEAQATAAKRQIGIAAAVLGGVMTLFAALLLVMVFRPLTRLSRAMAATGRGERVEPFPCAVQADEFGALAREIAAAVASDRSNRKLVEGVASLVQAAGSGDLSHRLSTDFDQETLQGLAEGLNRMMTALDQAFAAIHAVMQALADGDLGQTLSIRLPGRMGEVLGHAETARTALAALIEGSRDGTQDLTQRIGDLSGAIGQLQQRTESSAAALEQSSAALVELTSSVSEASRRADRADQISASARSTAQRGLEVMAEVTRAMDDIRASSAEISQIVDMIGSIAFQTNLLALNARVEAARAGDAGKGFAVVASEVSALSIRASEATSSIGKLIARSSQQVADGVTLIGKASGTIDDITGSIGEISGLATEIASAMREQSVALSEVSRAVEELDRVTQQNAGMVSAATGDTERLRQGAGQLSAAMSRFRLRGEDEDPRSGQIRMAS